MAGRWLKRTRIVASDPGLRCFRGFIARATVVPARIARARAGPGSDAFDPQHSENDQPLVERCRPFTPDRSEMSDQRHGITYEELLLGQKISLAGTKQPAAHCYNWPAQPRTGGPTGTTSGLPFFLHSGEGARRPAQTGWVFALLKDCRCCAE